MYPKSVSIDSLENRIFLSSTLTWKTVAPMPLPRSEGASFVADGKFFCFGGFSTAETLVISNEMDAYDPTTNTWTRMADCPVKVNDNPVTVDPVTDTAWCGGFFLNDGYHASGLMYAYHVKTNTWTQGPSLPMNVGAGQMGVVGRELYYFGGRSSSNVGSVLMWKLNLDDPNATWVADKPMLYTANHDGAVVLNNKIFAIGGIVNKEETTSNENHVQVFDPSSDQWTLAAAMPIGLGHIASAVTVANGDIIVAGGQVNGAGQVMSKEVLQYDPTANQWAQLTNLPDYRTSDFVGYLDGKLIITGGNMYNSPYINTTTWTAVYPAGSVTLPSVSLSNASAPAGSIMQFTATLSSATTTVVTANYSLTAGTASTADFDPDSGTLTFPIGATQATVNVPTYGTTAGTSEQFTLTLGSISTNAVFANGQANESATGTITPVAVTLTPSITTLTALPGSVVATSSVTLTANVTDSTILPTGTVTFSDNGITLGSAMLDQTGVATLTTTSLPAGSDSIVANYSGDTNVSSSVSSVAVVNVVASPVVPLTTTTSLSASASTVIVGQSQLFTAIVSSSQSNTIPTGAVTLVDNGVALGSYALDATGKVDISLPAVAPSLSSSYTAVYSGDVNFAGSTSNVLLQSSLPASATQAIAPSPALPPSGIAGQPIAARVPITLKNTGTTESGKFTFTLYADTEASGLSAAAVPLETYVRKMQLKAGKLITVPIALKALSSAIPTGTYHIVTLMTDPSGDSDIVATSQTLAIASPVTTLSASVGPITPSTVRPGRSALLTFSVTNTGNLTARGKLDIEITASNSDGQSLGHVLALVVGHASLRVGGVAHYRLRLNIPATMPADSFYPLIAVSIGTFATSILSPTPVIVS